MNTIAWAMWWSWWWPWRWAPRQHIRCTYCGREGHIAANCPQQPWKRKP